MAELEGGAGAEASSPPLGLCRVLGAGALAHFRPGPPQLGRSHSTQWWHLGFQAPSYLMGVFSSLWGMSGRASSFRGLPPFPSSAWCRARGWQHPTGGEIWAREPGGKG